jgi:micrococcal nuclease
MKMKTRKQTARLRGAILAAVIVLAACSAALLFSQPLIYMPVLKSAVAAQPGLYPVVYVDDGDTIIVRMPTGNETVRLLGADTPEVKDPRKPVQCYGPEASAHTKAVLGHGASVRLAPDPDDTDRDKYGRLLRYVYLPDGTLYNAELIRDGYAFAYTVFSISKLDDFRGLESQARAAGRGLWSACRVDESSIIKQTAGTK